MRLKIGELARRSGLTVRTLHHYDAIGLLQPSARADNGYRLYGRDDIARLHRIQALRRFGLTLAEIGDYLNRPDTPLADLVSSQIDMLTQQIEQAARLRERLTRLRGALLDGAEPELADWLGTLELMNMYDQYFSKEELDRLPLYGDGSGPSRDWPALVEQVQGLMDAGIALTEPGPRALALQWMQQLVRDTDGDPRLLVKLNAMHEQEPAMQAHMGISPAMRDYVLRAFSEHQMRLFEKYLTPEEAAFMRAHYSDRASEWPQLMADVRDAIDAGQPPASPAGIELARRWLDLFRSYAGDSPATQARFREAMASEPELSSGTWASGELIGYMREAMAALMATK